MAEMCIRDSNIYESVWNEEFLGEDNAVNVHISNIRQKLAKVHGEETYIGAHTHLLFLCFLLEIHLI